MWRTVCRLGVLDLDLRGVDLGRSDATSGWHAIGTVQDGHWPENDMTSMVSRVQKLALYLHALPTSESCLLQLMEQCPDLREVKYHFGKGSGGQELMDLFRKVPWKNLRSLDVENGFCVNDQSFARIVEAMPEVRSLSVLYAPFGPQTFNALEVHTHGLSVIQDLELRSCEGLTSKMICAIFESSPNLVRFTGTHVEGKDLVESGPWACSLTLKTLSVNIYLSPGRDGADHSFALGEETRAILGRISSLSQLESLSIDGEYMDDDTHEPLRLCLDYGMDQLKTLTKMALVDIVHCSYFVKEAEVVWMLDHWPRMRDIRLRLKNEICLADERLDQRAITFYHDYS